MLNFVKEFVKKTWIILILLLVIIATILFAKYQLFKIRTFSVAVFSDIHMGANVCNHKQCGEKIEPALREMLEKTSNMLLLSIGDNTDASEFSSDQERATVLREEYKKRLLEITKNREVLWANGNHDRETYLSNQEYYSYDKNNWRFIIIHTIDVEGEQFKWLKNQLETEKNKIIIMHHPVFKQGKKEIIERYDALVDLFREKKVAYVLSGHWHDDHYERNMDGVIYKAIRGLTYNYQTNYDVLNLNYRLVDTWNLSPELRKFISYF